MIWRRELAVATETTSSHGSATCLRSSMWPAVPEASITVGDVPLQCQPGGPPSDDAVTFACPVYHLERTETGRLRFFDVTEASEREMGEMAAQEILQQYSRQILPDNHPTTKYVRKVADRILAASGLDTRTHGNAALTEVSDAWGSSNKKEGVNWKVRVIKDDSTKNAFVLPNGAIFVFTGILPVCANEDGLAAVLGHEVAHQVARHAGERMSSQKINLALSFLASFLGIDPSLTSPAIGLMLTLPNSRAAETEADHIGLKLASRACYNPAEAAQMWERMKQSEGGSGGGRGASIDFLSTHPANEKRIQQIREWLPEANRIREDSCGTLAEQKSLFSQAAMSPWR